VIFLIASAKVDLIPSAFVR